MAGSRWSYQGVLILLVWLHSANGYVYDYHYMEDHCSPGQHTTSYLNISAPGVSKYGFVRVVREDGYPGNFECSLQVSAPPDYYLTVRIRRLDVYRNSGCGPSYQHDSDFLEIRGYNSSVYYCGQGTPSASISSLTTTLTFRFYSYPRETTHSRIGFDLYYTAFHRDECDKDLEFQCNYQDRCIPKEVKCDKFDNCGDWSDEKSSVCGLSTGAIVGITTVVVLAAGTCVAFGVFYFYTEHRRKKHAATRNQNEANQSASATAVAATTVSFSTTTTAPTHNQYAVGVEPPPAYTFSADNVYEKVGPDIAGHGQLGPYYAGPYGTFPDTQGGAAAEGAAAGAAYNIPPPAYDNPGYATSTLNVENMRATCIPPTAAPTQPAATDAVSTSAASASATAITPVESPASTNDTL